MLATIWTVLVNGGAAVDNDDMLMGLASSNCRWVSLTSVPCRAVVKIPGSDALGSYRTRPNDQSLPCSDRLQRDNGSPWSPSILAADDAKY